MKKTRDEALEHIKVALRAKSCLFTTQQISFICTSCQILGIDYQTVARTILEGQEQEDKGTQESDGAPAGSIEGTGGQGR